MRSERADLALACAASASRDLQTRGARDAGKSRITATICPGEWLGRRSIRSRSWSWRKRCGDLLVLPERRRSDTRRDLRHHVDRIAGHLDAIAAAAGLLDRHAGGCHRDQRQRRQPRSRHDERSLRRDRPRRGRSGDWGGRRRCIRRRSGRARRPRWFRRPRRRGRPWRPGRSGRIRRARRLSRRPWRPAESDLRDDQLLVRRVGARQPAVSAARRHAGARHAVHAPVVWRNDRRSVEDSARLRWHPPHQLRPHLQREQGNESVRSVRDSSQRRDACGRFLGVAQR